MSLRSKQLAQKRRELLLRSARQRQEVIDLVGHLEARLMLFDRVIGAVTSVARHPLILIAAFAGTMMLGPWKALRWVSQGAMILNLATRLRRLVAQ